MTVAKSYRLLRAIMTTAVEDGLIRQNPCPIKGGGMEASPEPAGRGTVAISDVIVPDLGWHLQRLAEPGPAGRVFVGPNGAAPRRNNFTAIRRKAVAGADLSRELHFHDLRHSGNTLAAATEASLAELMRRMGHAELEG
ncbi:site-specific integrase [Sporichthya polymorpha]|uniref:site-specific integrase n=1 Tax=Sporichthya polymorpha TaxID=35751 RepID=UPI000373EC2B|nr:site-specific integrase [Sporichthya polymorpha]